MLRPVVMFAVVAFVPSLGVPQTPREVGTAGPDFHVQVWGERDGDFTARVGRYFELRQRLQSALPALIVTNDVRQIRRGTQSLANAIRAARPGAAQGEFFTVGTSAEFKRILARMMNATLWAAIMDDNPGAFPLEIDATYAEGQPHATTPGTILARLPRLPDDIEFRFVGRHLILFDVRANTIIDRLPDAIECTGACSN